ncbi:MAG: hypothetical protein ACE5EB_04125 [Thermodesulfobacteriota bacterium]
MGEVTALEGDSLTVRFENRETRTVYLGGIDIVRLVEAKEDDLRAGDNVVVRGKSFGGAIEAFLIQITSGTQGGRMPPGGMPGLFIGKIESVNPLTVVSGSGETKEVRLSSRTMVVRGTSIQKSDLHTGDRVRIMPGRLLVINSSRKGGVTAGAKGTIDLPIPPEVKRSYFDRQLMEAKGSSPFGFFDPNMLRFKHISWFKGYEKAMTELGAYWAAYGATFSFNWNLLQRKNPDGAYAPFNWARLDRLVKRGQAHNIHIIGYIKASEPGVGFKRVTPSLPKDLTGYKNFVRAVVERYDGDGKFDMPGLLYPIKYWSIEDEPLAPVYFNGTGADYAELLSAAYEAVKSTDPGAKVICSMIRGTGWIGRGDPRSFMVDFFKRLAELGETRPYDIMDQHMIGAAPQNIGNEYAFYKGLLDDLTKTAKKYGFGPAPFFALEVSGKARPERDQAIDLLKRHVYLLSLDVRKILWSGLKSANKTGGRTGGGDAYFRDVTLIDSGGGKKLAYYTYKLMVKKLDGADMRKTEALVHGGGLYVFKFQKNGNPVWVLWTEKAGTVKYDLPVPGPVKRIEVTGAVPERNSGKEVPGYNGAFKTVTKGPENGSVTIELSRVPVIVTVP